MALDTEELETYWDALKSTPTFPCTPDIHVALDRLLDALNHYCWLLLNVDSKGDAYELPEKDRPYIRLLKDRKTRKFQAFLHAPTLPGLDTGFQSDDYAEVVRALYVTTTKYFQQHRAEQLERVRDAEVQLGFERAELNFIDRLMLQMGEFRPEQPNLPLNDPDLRPVLEKGDLV